MNFATSIAFKFLYDWAIEALIYTMLCRNISFQWYKHIIAILLRQKVFCFFLEQLPQTSVVVRSQQHLLNLNVYNQL